MGKIEFTEALNAQADYKLSDRTIDIMFLLFNANNIKAYASMTDIVNGLVFDPEGKIVYMGRNVKPRQVEKFLVYIGEQFA